jgi:hypothetical protein
MKDFITQTTYRSTSREMLVGCCALTWPLCSSRGGLAVDIGSGTEFSMPQVNLDGQLYLDSEEK